MSGGRFRRTLCIDVGPSGLKAVVVSPSGKPLSVRARVVTPRPATPRGVTAALRGILPPRDSFDRVSVGFPGTVVDGVVETAPSLHRSWAGFDLATWVLKTTGRPTRVMNEAGVLGHGAVQGRGTEICVALGPTFGFSLFANGHHVPNVDLGHHPFRKGKSYEELLGDKALRRRGKKRWNRSLLQAITQLQDTFHFRMLYLEGGNVRHIQAPLPRNVKMAADRAGLVGGVKMWELSLIHI